MGSAASPNGRCRPGDGVCDRLGSKVAGVGAAGCESPFGADSRECKPECWEEDYEPDKRRT